MLWAGHVACTGSFRNAYSNMVEKESGTKHISWEFGRKWEFNIKTDLNGMGMEGGGVEWMNLDQRVDKWRDIVNSVRRHYAA